ncbi:NUDIX domain-containing protein [Sediminibacterium soli]|uniref:NUDIX domain-containing protein n=1 Tax=Sediminibacterium soli TaxID=2698829 RepID=UPI00137B4B32|nr:NUDIX hydrolase [Sediminibacterium soli]NCI45848.1 NUDIX hydrolase [Sediminibacterium soli]
MTENPWKITGEKLVYENPWISLTQYDVITPGGTDSIYGKVHFKNRAVGIVALDGEGCIWLVGQYRFVLDEYSWEIPEGGCPVGTDMLDSAKRELLEETGLKASEWEPLLSMHVSNSVSDEWAEVFIARGLTQHEPEPEDTEQLQVKRVPFEEVYAMVEKGEITDSISVAAILKTKLGMVQGKWK